MDGIESHNLTRGSMKSLAISQVVLLQTKRREAWLSQSPQQKQMAKAHSRGERNNQFKLISKVILGCAYGSYLLHSMHFLTRRLKGICWNIRVSTLPKSAFQQLMGCVSASPWSARTLVRYKNLFQSCQSFRLPFKPCSLLI